MKEAHPEWLGVDLIKFKISDEEYDCTACGVVYKTRAFYKHVRRVHPDWRGVSLSKFKIDNDGGRVQMPEVPKISTEGIFGLPSSS